MKCIYWNTKSIQDVNRIADLLMQELPDFFFLSEINKHLLETNNDKFISLGYEYYLNPGCERVSIIKNLKTEAQLGIQNKYFTTVKAIDINTYIISLHLPSQLFQHMDSLKEYIRDLRLRIDIEIGPSDEKQILLIGDFNVNPYEKPMIDFDGFLATNSTKARRKIVHLGNTKNIYYNPTWQLYSRKSFPGTKYFPRPSASSYDIIEYHFLDQVVISQLLSEKIHDEKIKVIESSSNYSFYNIENNSVEGSDHLPLSYQFSL